ncbi:FAS1-like dehydratase domain-containing protein [Leptospira sarikeiensis]|uniref:MaoC family dehydratase n=1 Tax=Leptospira sarikeiensis TaxID=2484943 RepID=A0A4R9K3T3_9LEPT|nr:MaoC family dehydratase N-terminal domain-containing protein [Leptospira sarikeiensis]TGL60740.1 MaoC family dehydratase [Leptospira sarikeiensis]
MAEKGISKDLIGTKLDAYEFDVERGKIKEFCLAIGESNPIYFDVEAAKKAGYEDIPAPPTFPTVIQFWGYPKIWKDMENMGVDTSRILHLKEKYNYVKTLYPGKVSSQGECVNVTVGKMDTMTFRTTIRNSKGETVIEAEMSIFIRKPEQ